MKVLIVEDNSLTRTLLKALLEQVKWEVAGEAADGVEAVNAFVKLRPDVVFLDLIMPGKSGLEVLDEIREINPAIKVVVITAVEQDEISKKLSAKGVNAVLRKPFSYEEFEQTLKSIG